MTALATPQQGYALDEAIKTAAVATAAGIADGSITTGIE